MTYKLLLNVLNRLTEEQLNQDVTVAHKNEFFPVNQFGITIEDGVLDKNHFFLKTKETK